MNTELQLQAYTCPRCQAGKKHLRLVTFVTWIGSEMITVPGFPAWVCDICGHSNFDNRALTQLSLVLNPQAGQPVNQPYAPPPANSPQTPPPPGN